MYQGYRRGDPIKELEQKMLFWGVVKLIVAVEVVVLLALIISEFI